MEQPTIDEMTIGDIDEMVGVGIEFRLDGRAGLYTPKDVRHTFGGPIKTRPNLIRTDLDSDEYSVYIRGYVCVMEHHDQRAVHAYVKRAIERALQEMDTTIDSPSLLGEVGVTVGERCDVETVRGNEMLSRLETGL